MCVCLCAHMHACMSMYVYERGVGEKESALGIKHYALQRFGCVSLGNSLFGNWTSYIRQEMMQYCSCYSKVQT